MVPEGRRVFPFMSVRDNLMMGAFTRAAKAEVQAEHRPACSPAFRG